jgi:hypothetical protein
MAKVSPYHKVDICELWVNLVPDDEIASRYGIDTQTVSSIITRDYIGPGRGGVIITKQSKINDEVNIQSKGHRWRS